MSLPPLPATIRALVSGENSTAGVQTLNFASEEHVRNLDPSGILVKVRAVALNPSDWKHNFGEWGLPGNVYGCDAAGDVVRVGSDVQSLQVGDRVGIFNSCPQPTNGIFAEYAKFDSALAFKLPEGMTYEEGASFPAAHYTAFQALYLRLNLPFPSSQNPKSTPKAQTILIWGASTSVNHHAFQLAHLSGLRVFVVASPDTHAHLKSLGADETFDYKDEDVVRKILEAAGEGGVTLGLDGVVEKGSTEKVIDCISPRGGKVIPLLPVPDAVTKRREDVDVEFTLVYTVGGHELTFAKLLHFDPMPSDRTALQTYLTTELPALLEGWEEGKGSTRFKTQRLRKITVEGGEWYEAVLKGLRILQSGEYGREKLVVTVA
ncbi:chaperonin 10-like protein [Pterulicium gracile]|uniref:Chaperonin 10-like protein n=1 Tax=Pterulicium gracile TaxID=1884261 RepID=A0A5C3QAB3_9AGAR|nr:chaperonin 10-like protein [Pterula gracilis]